jgi:hypothetical protein
LRYRAGQFGQSGNREEPCADQAEEEAGRVERLTSGLTGAGEKKFLPATPLMFLFLQKKLTPRSGFAGIDR